MILIRIVVAMPGTVNAECGVSMIVTDTGTEFGELLMRGAKFGVCGAHD